MLYRNKEPLVFLLTAVNLQSCKRLNGNTQRLKDSRLKPTLSKDDSEVLKNTMLGALQSFRTTLTSTPFGIHFE